MELERGKGFFWSLCALFVMSLLFIDRVCYGMSVVEKE